jgi:hypothetical protein
MTPPTESQLEGLIKDFLVANTAYYFFKKLRAGFASSSLFKEESPSELQAFFLSLSDKKVKSAYEVVLAYLCIFHLAQMEDPQARVVLNALPVHLLDWGIELRDICQARTTPEVRKKVSLGEFILSTSPSPLPASTSEAHIFTPWVKQRP